MANSGNGGFMKIGTSQFDIGKWTLNKDPRLVESGTSGQTGGTRYTAVKDDPSWECELPWDSIAGAELAGLTEGASIALLKFKCGNSSLYYSVANTTVGPISVICDNNGDVVRQKVTGKGGDVSGPA